MKKLKETKRIKNIEKKWGGGIESLLHDWHWKKGLTHRKISKKLNVPRSSITRWFEKLNIPTQDSSRITVDLSKTTTLERQNKEKTKNQKKQRKKVNEDFFKKWTKSMAYVLGYFAADGYMYVNPRGSCYIAFSSVDKSLIIKVREILESNHSIGKRSFENPNRRNVYRLQIGSKKLYKDLEEKGFFPNKTKRLTFPKIPNRFLHHFVRGYFDGDGCVNFGFSQKRGKKSYFLITKFSSGSKKFIKTLLQKIHKNSKVKGGSIYQKPDGSWDLSLSIRDSLNLFKFMHKDAEEGHYLRRKFCKFKKAKELYGGVA